MNLSVIVPTHARPERLRDCLLGLNRQCLAASEFEVIVVVDGESETTRQVLASLAVGYRLRICWQARLGQCAARNRGAAEAAGDYLLFLDDDVRPGRDLLAVHLQAQRTRGGVVGLGQLTMGSLPPGASGLTRYAAHMWNEHYARLNTGYRQPEWRDCYTGNLSVPRAAYLAVGGLADDLPVRFDLDLGYRLERYGLQFVYLPEARGEHNDYKDFSTLARAVEAHGEASVELCRRHPAMRPELIGRFGEMSGRASVFIQALVLLDISSGLLAFLSRLLGGRAAQTGWYACLFRYFYWRGVRRALPDGGAWRRITARTPVLMYHAFSDTEPPSRYIVTRRQFERQMRWLKLTGRQVLSLEEYLALREAGQFPPPRSVVISADDGYADFATQAFPVLRKHGFPATVFIVSGKTGGANDWDQSGPLVGRPLLGWGDMRGMLPFGISFGAHTRTHPRLPALTCEEAQAEIAASRTDLEHALGRSVRVFAYPHGANDVVTRSLVAQAGFAAACSVHSGANTLSTPDLALRRIEVAGTDSMLRFVLALWLGDDRLARRRWAE